MQFAARAAGAALAALALAACDSSDEDARASRPRAVDGFVATLEREKRAYRVRAVLGNGRVSRWSEPYAAGEEGGG